MRKRLTDNGSALKRFMIQLQKAKSMCLSKTVQNKALLPLSDAALISLRLLTPNLKNFTPSPIKHKMTGKTWKCGYDVGAAASQLAAAKVTWAVLACLVKLSGRNNYEMRRVLCLVKPENQPRQVVRPSFFCSSSWSRQMSSSSISNQTQKRERVQTQLEFRASLNLCVFCVCTEQLIS